MSKTKTIGRGNYTTTIEQADWSIKFYDFETRKHYTRRVWFGKWGGDIYVQLNGRWAGIATELDGVYSPWAVSFYNEVEAVADNHEEVKEETMKESTKTEYTIEATVSHRAAWERDARATTYYAEGYAGEYEGFRAGSMDDAIRCESYAEAQRIAALFAADMQAEVNEYADEHVVCTINICEYETDDVSSEYVCCYEFDEIEKEG